MLEYAKYVLVFTTLEAEPAEQILECYRLRWQIELVFKRRKTLAQLGHLPKHDDRSARVWLYGKLLIALLTQKLIRIGRDISPRYHLLRPISRWREFSFALHLLQHAIQRVLRLRQEI